jgi:hypothetical protein
MRVLRANQIYSRPGKPGLLPTRKTHFHAVVEHHLERVELGPKAVGFTETSLEKYIASCIAKAKRDSDAR